MSIYGVCTQSTIMWKNKVFLIDQKLWRILKKWNLRMKEGATDYSVKWRVAPKADTKGRHTRNWKEPWGSSVVTGWIHQHEQLGSSILLYLLLQDPTAPSLCQEVSNNEAHPEMGSVGSEAWALEAEQPSERLSTCWSSGRTHRKMSSWHILPLSSNHRRRWCWQTGTLKTNGGHQSSNRRQPIINTYKKTLPPWNRSTELNKEN